ncbi:MAG: DNA-3-methyladenine glycosylase [Lachnospiraceae bacterium]|nr:DNA-3-methyladenine glycosylase [Lachnospiraceae bacterium]
MPEKRLERAFFMTDALVLSKNLIGKIMVHNTPFGRIRGIITETEAYMGVEDKGSHTYGGKRTNRTEPMFHIGGTSYVYFIYGMYNCVNVTAGAVDTPMAVLIRQVEPADEESCEIMERLRGKKKNLSDGPGKLCIAMNITKADNDIDMVTDENFYLTEGIEVDESRIAAGKRIGIDYAEEAADYLWRFTLT